MKSHENVLSLLKIHPKEKYSYKGDNYNDGNEKRIWVGRRADSVLLGPSVMFSLRKKKTVFGHCRGDGREPSGAGVVRASQASCVGIFFYDSSNPHFINRLSN